MEKIPTAEEMFEANPILPEGITRQACIAFMRAFATLHVKAALKEASICKPTYNKPYFPNERVNVIYSVDKLKDSILKSYPLTNIK